MSKEFSSFLSDERIVHKKNLILNTPQQNGIAERKNRHVIETIRALLVESLVPPRFWCEAAQTVVYLTNRLPSPVLNNTTLYQCMFANVCLITLLHITTSVFLDAFASFIFPLMKEPNFHRRQQNAFFLAIVINAKVFFVMILSHIACISLVMWLSLNICLFFTLHSQSEPTQVTCLPLFPLSSPPVTQVYA